MTRSFVFLNLRNAQVPAAMVVFDRVVSADPAFRKYWLLHTLEEPRVDAASAVVDCTQHGNSGRLTLDVLLADRRRRGPGQGRRAGQGVLGLRPELRQRRRSAAAGTKLHRDRRVADRVVAKKAAAEDLFLNVMQVTDRQSPWRWPVQRLDAGQRVGCVIEGPESAWVVLMHKDSQRSAEPLKFTVPGQNLARMLVTDLSPGRWNARREGSAETLELLVNEDSGAAWFEGPAGTWTLSR